MNRNLLVILLFSLCLSCSKEDDENPLPVKAERMVLVYIAGNNDLQLDAITSIKKMEAGAGGLKNPLLVYIKTSADKSFLLKIKYNKSNRIISDTLKVYGNENSADPDFLKRVIADSRELYPANNYGLVLWSHATSWAPPGGKVKPESFGYDDAVEMDIKDLKHALPDDLEFIMFDACSMASMEVCYELKDKARYILASPAEILSSSFPYDIITPHLFCGVEGLKKVAAGYIDYYNSLSGLYSSATISLIDTRELGLVAGYTKALLEIKRPVANFNIEHIQQLDFDTEGGVPAYDFISFLENNYQSAEYKTLQEQINKAILYKGHTRSFFDLPIKSYSGLSVYLPVKDDPLREYYSTFSWYGMGGWNNIFF